MTQGIVIGKVIKRVVGCSNEFDFEVAKKGAHGDRARELLVSLSPNGFSGVSVELFGNAEDGFQFHMRPLIDGVADGEGEDAGEGFKFVKRISIAGDEGFLNPASTHETPLVMVML